jgi:secreted trypsin-like serine protease
LIVQTISGTYRIPSGYGSYYSISKSYICGGTIINKYTILTAGHCIETSFSQTISGYSYTIAVADPYDASQYSVYVGAYDVSFLSYGYNPTSPTVKMSVRKVIRHPNYDSNQYSNDVAIYLLSSPIEFNDYVQPACLPAPSYGIYPTTNSTVYASGWVSFFNGCWVKV